MKRFFLLVPVVIGLFVLAACGGTETAVTPAPTAMMPAQDTGSSMSDEPMADNAMAEEPMGDEPMADEPMANHNDTMTMEESTMDLMEEATAESDMDSMEMMDHPAWQSIALTDARSGETFTLADFAGKTVYVEPMATWCTNCRQQLNNVAEIHEQFGDDVVFIGLSLETNLNPADLAVYAENQGYDWTFAVMTQEMLQSLADTYGRTITNAPSTPHFIIRADGSHTDLSTGIDSPDQLVQLIQAAQS